MKKLLLTVSILSLSILTAQNNRTTDGGFDAEKALHEAKARGLQPADYAGYVKHQHTNWLKKNGLFTETKKQPVKRVINTVASATNTDFENGNYSGWSLSVGLNTVNSNGPLQNVAPVAQAGANDLSSLASCGADSMRHGLMTTSASADPVAGFSLTSPMGGNYVARVNRYCAGMEAAVISQTFPVTPQQNVLNYIYAVVLEDGGHMWGEQTYFMVTVKDQSGAIIDSIYMQAANGTTPGFYPCGGSYPNTYYKPWTPVSVNLANYIGQNVTVEVTASDCIYGGHSGYAYFDASLDSLSSVLNVWPGDANYDLTADMNDLLYLGWAYGATGNVRAGATINWQAEPSNDWGQTTAYGTEFKHADCNGDGTVDMNDTLAIMQNYGLQHAFRVNPNAVSSLSSYRNITLTPSTSTVGPNQPLTLSLALPTSTVSANNIYGIAFTMSVPSAYIASLTSTDFTNSFLGIKGASMLTLVKAAISQDHIDFCLVRNTHSDLNAGGTLFDVNLLASNFVSNGIGNFQLSNIKAVTYGGNTLSVGSYTAQVNFTVPVGVQSNTSPILKVVPNPATDKIYVEGLDGKCNIEIVNVIGQPVLTSVLDGKKFIDISGLEKGAYFIKLHTSGGLVIKKFIIE